MRKALAHGPYDAAAIEPAVGGVVLAGATAADTPVFAAHGVGRSMTGVADGLGATAFVHPASESTRHVASAARHLTPASVPTEPAASSLQPVPGTPMLMNGHHEVPQMSDVIDRFTAAIEAATMSEAHLFAADAVLDATVPHWRFTLRGPGDISDELGRWYADPGHFESISRTDIPGGAALVRFVLCWEENGEPHMCHQAHIIEHAGDRITRDTVYCGGRWNSALMAEMAEADAVNA